MDFLLKLTKTFSATISHQFCCYSYKNIYDLYFCGTFLSVTKELLKLSWVNYDKSWPHTGILLICFSYENTYFWFWLTDACLSVEGKAEGPGDQSRESRPAGPNFIQLLSKRARMVEGWVGRWGVWNPAVARDCGVWERSEERGGVHCEHRGTLTAKLKQSGRNTKREGEEGGRNEGSRQTLCPADKRHVTGPEVRIYLQLLGAATATASGPNSNWV